MSRSFCRLVIMIQRELSDFWARLPTGIEVAVGSNDPEKLLGVRDGFLRYFRDGLLQPVSVSVVAEPDPDEDTSYIPLSDQEILARARDRVLELRSRSRRDCLFFACSEAGVHSLEVEGKTLHFVRNWTVISGPGGEAAGGSGSLQLPEALIEGLDGAEVPFAIPGTRRRGGMAGSLTGGLETRRRAIKLATLEAIATLLYGVLEGRPIRG